MASEKSNQIIQDLIDLSVNVIRQTNSEENLPRSVCDQLTRSVTSIGANFAEAQDASSKKDFINKIYISKKEASETKYWLALTAKLTGNPEYLKHIEEVHKYVMMLQKIINTTKESNRT